MNYKGYTGAIVFSSADECLVGRLIGIRDIIAFHGDSVAEIRQAFEEAVDDYIAFCAEIGQAPQIPFFDTIEP
jgi:Uncharacterized protein encoded in hypervariable junctions of pilus gene clusters